MIRCDGSDDPTALSRGRRLALLTLVAAVAFGTFARTLSFGLLWDDPIILKSIQTELHDGGGARLVTMQFPLGAITGSSAGFYRPMSLVSLFVDSRLVSVIPGVYHLTNVLLHTLASVLLCRILWLALGSWTGGMAGALLFAVHPVHTETVAFVSGRTDLLACVFVMLSTLFWMRERGGFSRGVWPGRGLAAASLLLGMLSKEVAVMLPPILLAWDALAPPAGHARSWWERNRPWLGVWAAALAAAALARFVVAGVGLPLPAGEDLAGGLPTTALLLTNKLFMYLRLLVIPWPLNAFYTSGQITWSLATLVGGAVLLGGCAVFASSRNARAGLVSLAWIAGFLVPLFGVTTLSGSAAIAERYLYLPSAGLALLIGAAASRVPARARIFLGIAGAALLAALAALAIARAAIWRDEQALFSQLTRESPQSWIAHANLGKALVELGQAQEALEHLRQAERLNPLAPQVHLSLGAASMLLGRPEEAAASFSTALRLRPQSAATHNNLGLALTRLGRGREAMEHYREALRLNPTYAEIHLNLGNAYEAEGSYAAAAGSYRQALILNPDETRARAGLAQVLARLGAGRTPGR